MLLIVPIREGAWSKRRWPNLRHQQRWLGAHPDRSLLHLAQDGRFFRTSTCQCGRNVVSRYRLFFGYRYGGKGLPLGGSGGSAGAFGDRPRTSFTNASNTLASSSCVMSRGASTKTLLVGVQTPGAATVRS
jgi:hypothetical protein